MEEKIENKINESHEMVEKLLTGLCYHEKCDVESGPLGFDDKLKVYEEILQGKAPVFGNKHKTRKRMISLLSVAASVASVILIVVLFYRDNNRQPLVEKNHKGVLLVLENGEKIALQAELDGECFNKGSIKEVTSRELTYQSGSMSVEKHRLIVPSGEVYCVTLSDGTKVYLNSGSTLVYPVYFSSSERKVYLEGEAYFEVHSDRLHPFIVEGDHVNIQVTGTQFNASLYADDADVVVTLAEGEVSLRFQEEERATKLYPNNQVSYRKRDGEMVLKSVDSFIASSWKEGVFYFQDEELSSIVKKLMRWYNIQIDVEDVSLLTRHFNGRLEKYERVEKILDILSATGELDFVLEDGKVRLFKKISANL